MNQHLENLCEFVRSALGSLVNAWNTFPNLLFSNKPEIAMVAWTLLATIAIPVAVFGYSIIDGKRSSKMQEAQLEASQSSAAAAKSAAEQSLVQGLEATFEYETALKYFNEISGWGESPLKELGLRRIRMQSSVSLPGSEKSIESPKSLTYEAWKDYKDSFEKRFQESPLEFIKQIKNFLSEYGNIILDSEYRDIAQLIFSKKLKFNPTNENETVKDLFRSIPKLTEGSLEYSLNWPSDEKLNNIDLVASSISSLLKYDAFSRDKYSEIRSSIAQPIADFMNTQSFRNISDLGIGNDEKILETAVKIVYLAGESAKTHGGAGEFDHLKMRMIEGIPDLFRDIDFSKIDSLSYEKKIIIKEFWSDGCRQLKEDEHQVWHRMWPEIQILDDGIKSL